MSNEKMREEFELAYLEEISDGSSLVTIDDIRSSRSGSEYQVPIISGAWWAWQASRAAVVVELPSADQHDEDGYWLIPRTKTCQAIEAAGLKVKP